jgi:hypothetical protein
VQDFGCGFPETGSYSYSYSYDQQKSMNPCDDTFMSMRRTLKKAPACSDTGRCCRSDFSPGMFVPRGPIPGAEPALRYTYQPVEADCRYENITRGQVSHALRHQGSPLVVFGDSMMRQLFLRLVFLMRGQQRLLDPHLQTHAQYLVCKEADAFRVFQASPNGSLTDTTSEDLLVGLPSFFSMEKGPGLKAARQSVSRCSRTPMRLDFVWSPLYGQQAKMMGTYLAAVPAGVKPVLISSVGYWESNNNISNSYLNALKEAATAKAARKIFIVSVPTVKVGAAPVGGREREAKLREKNEFMKLWTEKQGPMFSFVDFDALSRAAIRPPGGGGIDKHYICSLLWKRPCKGCPAILIDRRAGVMKNGSLLPQIIEGTVGAVHTTEDGLCTDETNRAVWNIIFNTLIQ